MTRKLVAMIRRLHKIAGDLGFGPLPTEPHEKSDLLRAECPFEKEK